MPATTVQASLSLQVEVDYIFHSVIPAQRERGGLAISPAEHSYVEVSRICIRTGDKLVDITTRISDEDIHDIEDKILAMEEE